MNTFVKHVDLSIPGFTSFPYIVESLYALRWLRKFIQTLIHPNPSLNGFRRRSAEDNPQFANGIYIAVLCQFKKNVYTG